jgi:hypothetical protein
LPAIDAGGPEGAEQLVAGAMDAGLENEPRVRRLVGEVRA